MSTEFHNYHPNEEILTGLHGVDLVPVLGITASGKTTLIEEAVRQEPDIFHAVIPTVSRSLRHNEQQDIHIHARSEPEMLEAIAAGRYAQVAPRVFGPIYATAAEDYAPDRICLQSIIPAALPDFAALPFRSLRPIYILPSSYQTWRERVKSHAFDAAQWERRITEARRSLAYATTHDLVFVVNDQLDEASNELMAVVQGAEPQVTLFEGRDHARDLLLWLA
jgi:guanylate kinase